eukprot:1161418-Pelagomonas_calceolata.AAC.12
MGSLARWDNVMSKPQKLLRKQGKVDEIGKVQALSLFGSNGIERMVGSLKLARGQQARIPGNARAGIEVSFKRS